MNSIVETINGGFQFFIGLGGAAMMFVIITLISLIMKVKISKSIEGGLRMAIALTGMGAVIGLLTNSFAPALQQFVEKTGSDLSIVDLGWASMALITWSSMYTLLFAAVCILVNVLMIVLKKTDTLNVDLFNVWHLSIIGLLAFYYTKQILLSCLIISVIYVLMLLNADAMKPALNELLDYNEENVTTSAHPCFLLNPLVMLINSIILKIFPSIDKFDFDSESLNEKIGFWGSKYAVGAYLGVFIGILSGQSLSETCTLAFTGAVCLELFGIVGGWFAPAIEPLSDGVVRTMKRRFNGRKLNIGIDWSIVGVRAEIWTVANLLAPLLIFIAMILPGNKTLPLGGIIAAYLVPSLLIITRGKVIRMTLIGVILIPIFLWAATMIAPFMTSTSLDLGAFPSGLAPGSLFTAIEAIPLEKIFVVLLGETIEKPSLTNGILLIAGLVGYFSLFFWYFRRMKSKELAYVGQVKKA